MQQRTAQADCVCMGSFAFVCIMHWDDAVMWRGRLHVQLSHLSVCARTTRFVCICNSSLMCLLYLKPQVAMCTCGP
jgi:hypothetical protein